MIKKKAQVIVFCRDDKDLCLLRLKTNAERKGLWQNITGSLEQGETFDQGARRELFEETGIVCELAPIEKTFAFDDRWGDQVQESVFYCYLEKKPTIQLDLSEHQDFQWNKVDEVTPDLFGYPSNYEAFQLCLNHFQS